MGLAISGLLSRLFSKKPMRLLMLGLDNVGKTTILYQFKLGEIKTTIPTVGFNVETVEYKNLSFTMWDVGGGNKAQGLWRHYFADTQGIIFVIDSTDRERIRQVNEDLQYLLQDDELRDATLLVFANKQDLPDAMTKEEIVKELRLDKLPEHRIWHIQSATATKGVGLYEGLDWLSNELSKK